MFVVGNTPRKSSVASQDAGINIGQDFQKRESMGYVEGNLRIVESIDGTSEVMCVQFNAEGVLAVGYADGCIKIYNPDTGQNIHSLSDEDTHARHLPVTSIRFRPLEDGTKIEHRHLLHATYASGMIKIWHYTSQKCMFTINEVRQTLAAAFNPTGTKFVTVGADPQIHLYDMETRKKVATMEPSDSRDVMNGHRARVFAAQYHPFQGHVFITGGWDDTVQYWDDRDQHSFRKFYGPHICGDSLDIDPAHNHILTGSWRKEDTLQIWDFNTAEKIKDVPQDNLHGSLIYTAQWLGRDCIVCGGTDQNMARIIDRGTLNTVGQLVDLPQGVYCLHSDNNLIKPKIAIGASKRVYVVRMEKKQ